MIIGEKNAAILPLKCQWFILPNICSENPKYYKSLGESIIKVAKVVPDGLLIFFKSYGMMETCERLWRRSSIWTDLQQQKPIFIEPKDKHELKPMMLAYNASVDQNKGAIFMAVLRGKVSEGLDFADMYGRGVIIVGIPYGPTEDPRIILKKECLDRNRTRENQLISGDTWYLLEAIRAVNQAIGRVIRHKNDFGAILFLDDQFSERKIQAYISSWIKSHLTNQPLYAIPFGAVIHELTTFFTQPAIEAVWIRRLICLAHFHFSNIQKKLLDYWFTATKTRQTERNRARFEWRRCTCSSDTAPYQSRTDKRGAKYTASSWNWKCENWTNGFGLYQSEYDHGPAFHFHFHSAFH